ncbi:hypothetical protein BCR37DRAFT_377987 [Protomyces lactucae-debilis]|uniref:Uncharacterized protein n=1 Tax=Protomyces lactucae-debilis TaxID=2754530 RepID=A0A1Y2FM12_PROLT|nr:uncharacterized protein BCR37DRAFT_377987 [Protomyces lactucae-debilis]ORY85013.1 hypothetical protein BCR37DRAFT_377987 [Protomyces lactucae-debilis]
MHGAIPGDSPDPMPRRMGSFTCDVHFMPNGGFRHVCLILPPVRNRPNLFSRLSQAFAPAISIARMHYRNSSSLMTFTFTLVSLLLLVMHLELQHAAAEAGRSNGQSSHRGQESAVDTRSKKPGRGEGQSTTGGVSTSATVASDLPHAVEGIDYFPLAAIDGVRKCYNATFLISHIHTFKEAPEFCAMDEPHRQNHITEVCESWCFKEHAAYNNSHTNYIKGHVRSDTCIQSFNIQITKETIPDMASAFPDPCAFSCRCNLFNYVERIKMPYLSRMGQVFELSPSKPKSYWPHVVELSWKRSNPTGTSTRRCHYEDLFEQVGWTSDIKRSEGDTPATVKWQVECQVSAQNLPCDRVTWKRHCYCRPNNARHLFRPGQCEDGHENPRPPKRKKSKAKMQILDAGGAKPVDQCIAPIAHGSTPANNAFRADASSSGQAALAGNSAKPAMADMRLDPNDWEEWIATMSNVEQNPTTGLPVDRNVVTMQSCNNHGLFNHPGFEQPHADICVAPSHEGQMQGSHDEGSDDSQDGSQDDEADSYRRPLHFI